MKGVSSAKEMVSEGCKGGIDNPGGWKVRERRDKKLVREGEDCMFRYRIKFYCKRELLA